MIYALFRFLRYGERFIYVRRRDDEADMTAPSAFDGAVKIMQAAGYPIASFRAKKKDKLGRFLIKETKDGEEKECGCYIGLNLSDKLKSADLGDANYKLILYDEFITLDATRYLGSAKNPLFEYVKCNELYETVDRRVGHAQLHETTIVFIANAATYYNPIFLGLGVDLYITTHAKTIAPKGLKWVCEQIKEVEATKNIQQDKAATAIDERLAAYNHENIAFDDSPAFVHTIREPMQPLFNVVYNDHKMGVYMRDTGQAYICNKATQLQTVALTAADTGGVNYFYLRAPEMADYINLLKSQFYAGQCIYQTQKIKYEIANYMMRIPY